MIRASQFHNSKSSLFTKKKKLFFQVVFVCVLIPALLLFKLVQVLRWLEVIDRLFPKIVIIVMFSWRKTIPFFVKTIKQVQNELRNVIIAYIRIPYTHTNYGCLLQEMYFKREALKPNSMVSARVSLKKHVRKTQSLGCNCIGSFTFSLLLNVNTDLVLSPAKLQKTAGVEVSCCEPQSITTSNADVVD